MKRLFEKEQIITIPNLLSLVRLLLIPVIMGLYIVKQNYVLAVVFIALSGVTDVIDGFVARKFNMVSDFGKILDPVADKLTQAAMIICLWKRYDWIKWLFALFAAKEIVMGVSGVIVMRKKDVVNSAQWFGKLTTFVLYATMIILFLFHDIPETAVNAMLLVCAGVILMSMTMYLLFYRKLFSKKHKT